MELDELIDAICAVLPRGHGRGGHRRGEDGASAGAALELLYRAGKSSPGEIARALEIDVGTVKTRIFRGRKKLCVLLSENGNFFRAGASNGSEGGDQA